MKDTNLKYMKPFFSPHFIFLLFYLAHPLALGNSFVSFVPIMANRISSVYVSLVYSCACFTVCLFIKSLEIPFSLFLAWFHSFRKSGMYKTEVLRKRTTNRHRIGTNSVVCAVEKRIRAHNMESNWIGNCLDYT